MLPFDDRVELAAALTAAPTDHNSAPDTSEVSR